MEKPNPLHHILNPHSIAFVGANNRPTSMATIQMLNTLKFGFEGDLYPVHPTEKTVLGIRAYASVRDLPQAVDLAVITVPARHVPAVLEDCGARGVRYAVITSGGFGESGEEGRRLEQELHQVARKNRIRFVGPNCLGIVNPRHRVNVTMHAYKQPPGTMGFISQSGTYVTEAIHYLRERGISFSRALSIGNRTDIDLVDCLEYLAGDAETRAIALYIEGLKRPRLFLEEARKASRVKPIVALYVGGTVAGAFSARSHTGSICAPARLMRDVFRQAGIIEAGTIEDLFFWTWALANQPIPQANRIAVMTHSGGPATSIADACNKNGLEVPELSPETQEAIRALVPSTASIRNPIDLTFAPETSLIAKTLPPIVLGDARIDGLIIHGISANAWISQVEETAEGLLGELPVEQLSEQVEQSVGDLANLSREHGKPIVCSAFMGPNVEAATRRLHEVRIPTYDTPEKAVTAMSALFRYREILRRTRR